MAQKIRVRCPVCGMMPTLENLELAETEKPPEVELFLQKFGGKVKLGQEVASGKGYQKKKRGSAPGYMEYINITNEYPEQLSKLIAFFKSRAEKFLAGLKE